MSSDLEIITRAPQAVDYAPAKVFYNPGQIGVPNTHLMIGRGGSGKSFGTSYSANESFYVTAYNNEKKTADFGTVK